MRYVCQTKKLTGKHLVRKDEDREEITRNEAKRRQMKLDRERKKKRQYIRLRKKN